MRFDVVAWNSNEAFGVKERQAKAVEHIRPHMDRGTSVLAMSEVCRENGIPPTEVIGVLGELAAENDYRLYATAYNDKRRRANQPLGVQQYMATLVNKELTQTTVSGRLGTRNALFTTIQYEDLTVEGAWLHNDDRDEAVRRLMTRALLARWTCRLGDISEKPRLHVSAGDYNNLHRRTMRARVLRSASFISGLTGVMSEGPEPDRGGAIGWIEQLDSRLMRASRMAEGTSLQELTLAGFADADTARKATHPVGQLDHIMYRYQSMDAPSPVFHLGGKGPSDHRLVRATFVW